MNLDLTNKNALVCGASKGIGKACALVLSQLGANVTVVSRSEERLKNVVQTLDTANGQQHQWLTADFGNPDAVKKIIQNHVKENEYHILVNNTAGPPAGPIVDAQPQAFLEAYNRHLICNHLISTALIPGMEKNGYGRIINIISTSVKSPLNGLGVSNTTRGAVASWAKTMANELGPKGITVNNVLPGFTGTERLEEIIVGKSNKTGKSQEEVIAAMKQQVPLRRFANPEEVANAVGFLASPAAAYISGTSIPVDGGRTSCL